METKKTEHIYLDNAATTQLDDEVLNAMMPYLNSHYGNPSSIHSFGRKTRMAIEHARKTIAELLAVKPQNIIFTSGGTESNNMAILSAIRDLKCDHIITSKIEHHAVLHTVEHYARQFGIEISYVKLYEDGSVDQNDLRRILEAKVEEGKKCFVSLMNANNEIGTLTEISLIGTLCKKHNAIFHSDCVQTIGHYPLKLSELNLHFATGSAHKFHGPKGIGFLYASDNLHLQPLIFGGGHERGLRAGTENVAAIVGMAAALNLFYRTFTTDQEFIYDLKNYLASSLKDIFPGIIINSGRCSLYSVLSVSFPRNTQTEMLLIQLDQQGIYVSGGSACSNGGSHVMKELGKADNYVTIRFSFSRYNTKEDIDKVVDVLKEILQPQPASSQIIIQ